MLSERLKGVFFAFIAMVLLMFLWIGVEEYIYFQQLKAEHQQMEKTLLSVIGKDPTGQPYTRARFLEDLWTEMVRQNQAAVAAAAPPKR